MLALTLAAACSLGATGKITVAVPGLSYVDVNQDKGDAVLDYFGQKLEASGRLRVITRSEVGQLLGFERQKSLAGCSDAANQCMVELSEALGAEVILVGSLARLGSSFTISLKAARPGLGVVLFSAGERFANEDLLLEWLAAQAPRLVAALTQALRPDAPPAPAPTTVAASGGLRSVAWVPFALAGALAIGAGASLLLSEGDAARLRTRTPAFSGWAEIDSVASRGQLLQNVGWALSITAVVAALAGTGLAVFGGPPPVTPTVLLSPGGGSLGVAGVWPW